jgi:hypothetical protein
MRLTVYYFIFSMIPTFRRVVTNQHHICHRSDIDDILEYVFAPDLEREAIAKIPRIRTSRTAPFVTGTATGRETRTGSRSPKTILWREHSTPNPTLQSQISFVATPSTPESAPHEPA